MATIPWCIANDIINSKTLWIGLEMLIVSIKTMENLTPHGKLRLGLSFKRVLSHISALGRHSSSTLCVCGMWFNTDSRFRENQVTNNKRCVALKQRCQIPIIAQRSTLMCLATQCLYSLCVCLCWPGCSETIILSCLKCTIHCLPFTRLSLNSCDITNYFKCKWCVCV